MESWTAAAPARAGGRRRRGRPAAGRSRRGGEPSAGRAGGARDHPPAGAGDPVGTLEWRAPFVLDLPRTLGVHARGRGDPAYRVTPDGFIWRTSLTPEGPGTLRVAPARPGPAGVTSGAGPAGGTSGAGPGPVTVVRATAWGPGAAWLLRELPGMLGADDDRAAFRPAHPVLAELSARHPGVRVGRSARVLEALVPAVLEQKVVGVEARRAWRYLLLNFGDPAPGPAPAGMRVCPPARIWRRIPSWEWHRAGVEGVRARTIIGAAEVAARLEEIVAMPPDGGRPPAAVAARDRGLDLG